MRFLTAAILIFSFFRGCYASAKEDLAKVKAALEELKKANPKQTDWNTKIKLTLETDGIRLDLVRCMEVVDIYALKNLPLTRLSLSKTRISIGRLVVSPIGRVF